MKTEKRFFMRYFILTILIMTFMSVAVSAKTITEPQPPKALAEMVATGAQIFYLGEFQGMNGWALIREGKPEFFYENKDRTAMVMGLMFNESGEMVTMAQLNGLYERIGDDMYASTGGGLNQKPQNTPAPAEAVQPQPTAAPSSVINRPLTRAENMYADLLEANWITVNPNGKYDVFAFIDPDCPHCKGFLNQAKDYLTDGGLRLRIIPMGANNTSARKAAVLLSSANPADLLMQYAAGNESMLSAPENINTKAVEKNMSTMMKHGFDVTPIIIYRTGKGEIRLIRGRPADINMVINDIDKN